MTEIEKLRNVHRIEWLSEVEGFNINQLIEQIDIFRLLDKAKVKMKKSARKLGQVSPLLLSIHIHLS